MEFTAIDFLRSAGFSRLGADGPFASAHWANQQGGEEEPVSGLSCFGAWLFPVPWTVDRKVQSDEEGPNLRVINGANPTSKQEICFRAALSEVPSIRSASLDNSIQEAAPCRVWLK